MGASVLLFDFHQIVSLYAFDYDSDFDSVASENQPLKGLLQLVPFLQVYLPRMLFLHYSPNTERASWFNYIYKERIKCYS